jgi:hypothetical protein
MIRDEIFGIRYPVDECRYDEVGAILRSAAPIIESAELFGAGQPDAHLLECLTLCRRS